MVSVLNKELEYKVKKLKYKTLQPRIKSNFQFQLVNTVNDPGSGQMKFYSGHKFIKCIFSDSHE